MGDRTRLTICRRTSGLIGDAPEQVTTPRGPELLEHDPVRSGGVADPSAVSRETISPRTDGLAGLGLHPLPAPRLGAATIEAQFGPLRTFTMANSNYPNHTILARDLHAHHLRWRSTNARHPDLLTAQRRERARIRSEKGHRWGRPPAA